MIAVMVHFVYYTSVGRTLHFRWWIVKAKPHKMNINMVFVRIKMYLFFRKRFSINSFVVLNIQSYCSALGQEWIINKLHRFVRHLVINK